MAEGNKGFGKYTILRVMKENLPSDVTIKNDVKEGMEEFLENIVKSICNNIDTTITVIDITMFEKAIKPYIAIEENKKTDEKHVKYLDKIISDCQCIKEDINRKYE